MAGWVGPTIAIAMVIIAVCVLGVTVALLFAAKEAAEKTHGLSRELAELRQELSPALQSLNRLGVSGAEVAELAREEVRELVKTSQRLRYDVERGAKGFRRRAADTKGEVLEFVNDGLATLRSDGRVDEIYATYFGENE